MQNRLLAKSSVQLRTQHPGRSPAGSRGERRCHLVPLVLSAEARDLEQYETINDFQKSDLSALTGLKKLSHR